MRRPLYFVALAAAVAVASVAVSALTPFHADASPLIRPYTTSSFTLNGQKVWYVSPHNPSTARVLIVLHGQGRDGRSYRDAWKAKAREANALLIVPEFSDSAYPGDRYTLGPKSFTRIEPLFDAVKADVGNRSGGYLLYGHSAGAQFVHRFLLLVPNNRASRAVAANAGWYTAPEPDVRWPYGLRDSTATADHVARWLASPLTVLLGEDDTDTNDPDLRHTAGADRQGPHRLARGKFFYAAGVAYARTFGIPFGWSLRTVPGAEHSNRDMVPAAAQLLFGGA